MAIPQRHSFATAGEEVLFTESQNALDAANAALASDDPNQALKDFKAAYRAKERQDVIEAAFIAAVRMTQRVHDPLLLAEYFIFAARHALMDEMRNAAINAALTATEKAAVGNACELVDNVKVAGTALRVLDVTPIDMNGIEQAVRARDIVNRQINALDADDANAGTSNALIFINRLLFAQGDEKPSEMSQSFLMGKRNWVVGLQALRKTPVMRGQKADGDKPRLN